MDCVAGIPKTAESGVTIDFRMTPLGNWFILVSMNQRSLPTRRIRRKTLRRYQRTGCLIAFFYCVSSCDGTLTLGAELASHDFRFFEMKIRPVLVEHCYGCHSADAKKIQGGLLLDTRAGIRQGGDSGPSVTPGKPVESLLLEAMRYESFEMPPKSKLPDHVIADFEHWIETGADDPRDGPTRPVESSVNVERGRNFWAFRSPKLPKVPTVHHDNWGSTDIDRFILSKLESHGLQPALDAERSKLLRRVYYTLIGLPPTPDELERFCQDSAPLSEALARVVDRLLTSKQFGERWGRHWLDVVRYADSSGGGRSAIFPDAWRYRDYVIDSFNDDLPFDQFVQEQIAGDLLTSADWKQRRRQVIATAFLVLGPTNFELQDKDVLEMDIVDEQLDTLGKAFLGMTLGCARCHDHKFDPVPTHDYYAMAGIFKSTKFVKHGNVSTWHTEKLLPTPAENLKLTLFKASLAGLEKERDVLQAALKKLDEKIAALGTAGQNPQYSLQRAGLAKGYLAVKKKIESLKTIRPEPLFAMAVADRKQVGDIPVAIRGVASNKGPIVKRGVLQVCSAVNFSPIPAQQSGRLQLARWMTHPKHPLTSRVIVNRVWYWLFGEGLVRTVDNFGAMGSPPTHPELLDYLAVRFVEEGWSIKALIRQIMLSRTYRQSAQAGPQALVADPANRWLSRMNRSRLDAESLRDSMLFVGGELDAASGGKTIAPGTSNEYGYVFQSRRRSVFLPVFRNTLPELFEAFDFADPNIQSGWRARSTTVPQANYLMNHPFVLEMCQNAAQRLIAFEEKSLEEKIEWMYQQVLGRFPTAQETQLAKQFLGDETANVRRWSMLYQTLFQCIDFRYVN